MRSLKYVYYWDVMLLAKFNLILLVYGLDLLFGDPKWMFHPVKGMGRVIVFLEKLFGTNGNVFLVRLKGIITTLIVISVSAGLTLTVLKITRSINTFYYAVSWVILGYFTLATKDLRQHAREVIKAVKADNLESARNKLSLIVGRDTQDMDKERIIKSTIETVAENTADGIIAPLFYLVLGGPVLAMSYKAVNTLDSMIGYKNDRYQHFGWFAAKLDDVANWIPARLTGFLIVVSSFFLGCDAIKSFYIMRRDGQKHASPNSAIAEAATAGALHIQLGGACSYSGVRHEREFIGDVYDNIHINKADKAIVLSLTASLLMTCLGSFLLWII